MLHLILSDIKVFRNFIKSDFRSYLSLIRFDQRVYENILKGNLVFYFEIHIPVDAAVGHIIDHVTEGRHI